MRPETALTTVRNNMRSFYKIHDRLPIGHMLLDPRFIRAVDVCLRISIKNEKVWKKDFPDIPLITKSCYPVDNLDDILTNLQYISDRWNSTGRLYFLKDVINYVRNESGKCDKKM